MNFEQIEQLVSLLGKSELDNDVKEMLSFHKLKYPLPKPDGKNYLEGPGGSILVDSKALKRFGFTFHLAEYIENYPNKYQEGEAIFTALFYYPTKDVSGNIDLPFGVKIVNRDEQLKNLGEPSMRDDESRYYSWKFGKLEADIKYKKDCKTIEFVTYSVRRDEFWQTEDQISNMNKIVNASEIISLFGKSVDDPEVVSLMHEKLGTLNRPQPNYKNEDYYDWVLVRRKGVELGFEDSEYHKGADDSRWGKGDLRLYQAYFYTAFDDVAAFLGELPLGLKFEDSREAVRKKLAKYEPTRHSYITDTWDTDEFRLNVRYKDNQTIDRMECSVEFRPIQRKESVVFPALSRIIQSFGSDIHDQIFADLWGEYAASEILKTADEEMGATVCLGRSYGAELNFGGDHTFYAITLFGNRQIESVDWEGEIPCGLSFEDSPETLFAKMSAYKKAPDESSDDMYDNRDYALWHFPDYSLQVWYSHIYNRILRITLCAPGVWETE